MLHEHKKVNASFNRYTVVCQSTVERDSFARAFGPLPPTHYLHVEWPDGPAGMRFFVEPRERPTGEAIVIPPQADVDAIRGLPDRIPDAVVERARELTAWKRPDLETRAAEVGVAVKKNTSNAALVAMIAQAEHEKASAK